MNRRRHVLVGAIAPFLPAVALAIAAAPLTAHALEVAWVEPGYAGRVNRIKVTGATPGVDVAVTLGSLPGTTPVPGCPGLLVDMLVRAVAGPKQADLAGTVLFAGAVPGALAGQSVQVQAVEPGTCVVSAADTLTFPPLIEVDLTDATAQLTSDPYDDEHLGSALAPAGDVNDDGYPDMLVGAPFHGANVGGVYLVHGPVSGRRQIGADLGAWLSGTAAGDYAGEAVGPAGDVNQDGYADFLVGAFQTGLGHQQGEAYLVHGPVTGEGELATAATARLVGRSRDRAGYSVWSGGDVDDDGALDVLVGAPADPGVAGSAYVVRGPVVGTIDLPTQADTILLGRNAPCEACGGDLAGYSVRTLGDHDGDGFDDVLVAAPTWSGTSDTEQVGAVYVVNGPVERGSYTLDAIAGGSIYGHEDQEGMRLGESAGDAGDVNGDGYGDLIVAPISKEAMLFLGPVVGEHFGSEAEARFVDPGHINGAFAAGDLNGDGFQDIALGDRYYDVSGDSNHGAAYVFYAPVLGTMDVSTAQYRHVGEAGALAGEVISPAGDVDQDGYDDLLVGGPEFQALGGIAYLISGGTP